MKNNTLLLLASLALLTTGARAAQNQIGDDALVLPTYKVEAQRFQTVEKQINASLDEVRQSAKAPLLIPVECSALKAFAKQGSAFASMTPHASDVRVAKL